MNALAAQRDIRQAVEIVAEFSRHALVRLFIDQQRFRQAEQLFRPIVDQQDLTRNGVFDHHAGGNIGDDVIEEFRQRRHFGALRFGQVFGAQQLLLLLAALGNVAGDLGEADQLSFVIMDGVDDHMRPEGAAVLAVAPALILEAAVLQRGRQIRLRGALQTLLRAVKHRKVLADNLFSDIAFGALRPGVPVHYAAAGVQHIDGVIGDPFHQQPEALLLLALRPQHRLLLCAVAGDFGVADKLSAVVAHGVDNNVRPERAAVFAVAPALIFETTGAIGRLQIFLRNKRFTILGAIEAGEVLADNLFGDITFSALRPGVPVYDQPVVIQHINGVVGHALHQQAETRLLFTLFALLRLLFGAVARNLGEADQLAVGVANGIDNHMRPECAAIFTVAPAFGFEAAGARGSIQTALRHALLPIAFAVKQ